jgi:hypothetical protein
MLLTMVSFVSCTGESIEDQVRTIELKKLETGLLKSFGDTKFTKSLISYIKDKTTVKVLNLSEDKKSADVELTTVNKNILQGVGTYLMLGSIKPDSSIDDFFGKLKGKDKEKFAALKNSSLKGSCNLEEKEGKTVVTKCKL